MRAVSVRAGSTSQAPCGGRKGAQNLGENEGARQFWAMSRPLTRAGTGARVARPASRALRGTGVPRPARRACLRPRNRRAQASEMLLSISTRTAHVVLSEVAGWRWNVAAAIVCRAREPLLPMAGTTARAYWRQRKNARTDAGGPAASGNAPAEFCRVRVPSACWPLLCISPCAHLSALPPPTRHFSRDHRHLTDTLTETVRTAVRSRAAHGHWESESNHHRNDRRWDSRLLRRRPRRDELQGAGGLASSRRVSLRGVRSGPVLGEPLGARSPALKGTDRPVVRPRLSRPCARSKRSRSASGSFSLARRRSRRRRRSAPTRASERRLAASRGEESAHSPRGRPWRSTQRLPSGG